MYAQVVVLTYQSPDIYSYIYDVPEKLESEIKIGQLVRVPFGKRTPMGIILSTDYRPQTADYQIKHINSVILQIPILLPYQIELLKWLAFYYHAPMVNCLEAMLPTLPSSQFRVHSSQTKQDFEASVNSEQRTQNQLSVNREPSTVNQTLVLVPTINRLPETMAEFPQAKNYSIYHNELKMSEKFAVWQKIISGHTDFVFGSRSAIFTPCPALSKIIIFDEHDGAYKDERSPYFDTLTIAEKLQPLTGANLQIIDSAPKITTYFSHKNDMKISESKNMTTIVSMTDEKNKGNKSIVSDLLSSLILKAVARKEKTLLFLNKKRESGQFYCKTCRFHEFMPDAPQICPNCQSHDFFFNSLNIWSLAKTVKQLVPNANVNLIAEGLRYPTSDIRRPAIDIATASVFYKLIAYKYDLVAHILADTTLNIADFSALEKTFAQITNLKNLTKDNGRFLLQTYAQDHPVIKAAAQGNFQAYLTQSLSARKSLLYPPYALLVKLSIKGKSPEIIEKKAEKLIEDFSHFPLSTFHFPLSILGPYQPIFKTKVPTYNIILKHKLASYSISEKEKAIKNLSPYLEKISRDWQITVEPGSIN